MSTNDTEKKFVAICYNVTGHVKVVPGPDISRVSKVDRAEYKTVYLFFYIVYGKVLNLEFAILEKRLCPR